MHVLFNAKIKVDEDMLEAVSDLLENIGEVFYDDEEDTITVSIDDTWIGDIKKEMINDVFRPLYEIVGDHASLTGTIQDQDTDKEKRFKCKFMDRSIKYKDTDFHYIGDIDNMTYEELEEMGNNDFEEDDFDEYSHRNQKGKNMLLDEFGDWECFDI